MKKILFIEDDMDYASVIKQLLEEDEFIVDYVSSSVEGINKAKENIYDLIIIDLYLDKFLGIQIVEMLKRSNVFAKIILVSNSTNPQDELNCLRADVADFIKKDTSIEIFLERITRVLKANYGEKESEVLTSSLEEIEVDLKKRVVKKKSKQIHVTNIEYELLCLLLKNKNNIVSREKIIAEIWKSSVEGGFVEPRTVDTHIKNIKNKLKILSTIQSVRGIGYRWYED